MTATATTLKAASAAALLIMASSVAAVAQQADVPTADAGEDSGIECSAFQHNSDGSWNTLQPVKVTRQNEKTTIAPNMTLQAGMPRIAGLDLALTLDQVCPH